LIAGGQPFAKRLAEMTLPFAPSPPLPSPPHDYIFNPQLTLPEDQFVRTLSVSLTSMSELWMCLQPVNPSLSPTTCLQSLRILTGRRAGQLLFAAAASDDVRLESVKAACAELKAEASYPKAAFHVLDAIIERASTGNI
jgi:hypothetical protein